MSYITSNLKLHKGWHISTVYQAHSCWSTTQYSFNVQFVLWNNFLKKRVFDYLKYLSGQAKSHFSSFGTGHKVWTNKSTKDYFKARFYKMSTFGLYHRTELNKENKQLQLNHKEKAIVVEEFCYKQVTRFRE